MMHEKRGDGNVARRIHREDIRRLQLQVWIMARAESLAAPLDPAGIGIESDDTMRDTAGLQTTTESER